MELRMQQIMKLVKVNYFRLMPENQQQGLPGEKRNSKGSSISFFIITSKGQAGNYETCKPAVN